MIERLKKTKGAKAPFVISGIRKTLFCYGIYKKYHNKTNINSPLRKRGVGGNLKIIS